MATLFQERVYAKLKQVPRGKVTTYALLAYSIGCGSPRAIGQAMRRNPYSPEVPCHRVVASDGSIGGYDGFRTGPSIARKEALLKKEGVMVRDGHIVDFGKRLYRFS